MLPESLKRRGATVFEAMAYKYSLDLEKRGADLLEAVGFKSIPPGESRMLQLVDDLAKGGIHIITFTSPPSVRNLFRFAEAHGRDIELRKSLNEEVLVVAVGPPTRKAIEEDEVHVDVMPDVYKLGPMMKATLDYLAHDHAWTRKRALARMQPESIADESG
jgi:uroporphyrinogen-III synthase